MTALSLSRFTVHIGISRTLESKADETIRIEDAEPRKIVGDMIAAGACDSEYGVQMLMSVFPDRY